MAKRAGYEPTRNGWSKLTKNSERNDVPHKGLAEEFANAVERMFDRIEAMPELYALVLTNVRRGKLRRFPYLIYYRDQIEVIAVLHGSRDPELWQSRI